MKVSFAKVSFARGANCSNSYSVVILIEMDIFGWEHIIETYGITKSVIVGVIATGKAQNANDLYVTSRLIYYVIRRTSS